MGWEFLLRGQSHFEGIKSDRALVAGLLFDVRFCPQDGNGTDVLAKFPEKCPHKEPCVGCAQTEMDP